MNEKSEMPENKNLSPDMSVKLPPIVNWWDGKKIDEVCFCEEFLKDHPMISINDTFFTVDGRVSDENKLKKDILDAIKPYVTSGIAKRASNLLDTLRVMCYSESLPTHTDRIHLANGTLFLDGRFTPEKDYCRNRLPVRYNPEAPPPEKWLHLLSELLYPEDIPTDRKSVV